MRNPQKKKSASIEERRKQNTNISVNDFGICGRFFSCVWFVEAELEIVLPADTRATPRRNHLEGPYTTRSQISLGLFIVDALNNAAHSCVIYQIFESLGTFLYAETKSIL